MGARKENRVTDLIFVAVTIGFFVVATLYAYGCGKL
jgi:hypothetical protein